MVGGLKENVERLIHKSCEMMLIFAITTGRLCRLTKNSMYCTLQHKIVEASNIFVGRRNKS